MAKTKHRLLITILMLLLTLCAGGGSVLASPTTNVGLTRFEAIPLDNAVHLEWDTETELGTAGFMLKRSQTSTYDYLVDSSSSGPLFIISEGGPAFGSSYAYTDETAVNGEIYTYQLIEVEVNGAESVQAESTVTVGIVPTNTPIVLVTGGGNGNNTDSAAATETATLPVTTFPSPTPQINKPTTPLATPIPTVVPKAAAATLSVTDEVLLELKEEQPTTSGTTFIAANSESDGAIQADVAVAFAQDEPENYPVEAATTESSGESLDDEGTGALNELYGTAELGEDPDRPAVIGITPYPAGSSPTNSGIEIQNTESVAASSNLAGKVYLWLAFIAALVIFTAAILGAILLYTRQRSKE